LLTLSFLALGTGGFEFLHNLQHAREDAEISALAEKANRSTPGPVHHDESNCLIHFQLHLPMIFAGWVPLLVSVGVFVAFLTLLAATLVSQRPLLRLDCRGPPIL
jgi:hypothetical protein